MKKQNHKLTFLPLFKEGILEVTNDISIVLKNLTTEHKLVDEIEKAIDKRGEIKKLNYYNFLSYYYF